VLTIEAVEVVGAVVVAMMVVLTAVVLVTAMVVVSMLMIALLLLSDAYRSSEAVGVVLLTLVSIKDDRTGEGCVDVGSNCCGAGPVMMVIMSAVMGV
jgi:hypothetical protein